MISRMLELKTSLNEVMEEMQWDTLLYNEWIHLTDLSNVLWPFKEQTDDMQWDNLSQFPCSTKSAGTHTASSRHIAFESSVGSTSSVFHRQIWDVP